MTHIKKKRIRSACEALLAIAIVGAVPLAYQVVTNYDVKAETSNGTVTKRQEKIPHTSRTVVNPEWDV